MINPQPSKSTRSGLVRYDVSASSSTLKVLKNCLLVVIAARLLYKSGRLVDTQIKEMFLNLFTADGESSCINIVISKAINLSSTATDSAA